MNSQVSAIITTHNRSQLLKRAIESVMNQTYSDIECIIVDDASTDNTRQICSDYPVQYIFIPKEESRGGNYARNLGIKAAKGEYCAFLDDDDYWLPAKIEKQVALIERMDCELVHCGKRIEYVHADRITYKDKLPNPNHWGDMHKKILLTICTTTTTNILARRQALLEVGLFDENLRFWQDYELTIRLAQRKPFYFVNEPLSVYRIDTRDANRLTNKYYAWKDAVRYIQEKHAALYSQLNLKEKYIVKNLIWRDAAKRCRSSRLWCHYFMYKLLILPYRIISKLKRIYH